MNETQKRAARDYHDTVDFLEQLRPGGPWVLTAIVPDGRTETVTCTTHEDVIIFVGDNDGKKNLYFSVNPTRKALSSKASKFDIAEIQYLLADLDPKHGESPEAAKARYLKQLQDGFEPVPTGLLNSGNGIQSLWKLAQPIVLPEPLIDANGKRFYDDKTLELIKDIEARSKALMERLGSLAGTQNIDRIFRLPGTINIPNEKKLKDGRVRCSTNLILFNGALHELDVFPSPQIDAQRFDEASPNSSSEQKKPSQTTVDDVDKLERAIRTGGDLPRGQRSELVCYQRDAAARLPGSTY